MDHDFIVVIMRSDSRGIDRKIKLILGCERSGKYRPYKSELVRNVTGSRKCECPFRLRGRPLANGVGWKLNLVCGVHNHEVAESLEGHPYAGRLTVEEKSLLEDMTKNMVKPRSILLTLKDHNVHNVTTIKQIYNARTAFQLTFSVAFAYLERETKDNFTWALDKVRGMIRRSDALPQVIVTDRDFGLMNSIQSVFPSSYNLLCQFHIANNVKAKCKQLVAPSTLQQPFEELCPPTFFDYVNKTWIIPHKEKFVAAWIDRVIHLGNTTTNGVESAHARLKRLLQDSRDDICNCWDAMNNLIILQHTEIKASFQRSIMNLEHQFNNRLYGKLFGFVSKNAMVHIAQEIRRVEYIGIDTSTCGCKLKMTYGLPCACQLAICKMYFGFIPVEKVHAHWRRITFTDQVSEAECAGVTLRPELNELERRFDELNMDGKVVFKYKVRELAFPNTTSMCPPPEKVRTKGSMKGHSQTESSTKHDPSFFEYVDAMQSPNDNVARDGNCGYRAISALLGMGEESWPIIRQELYREICYWHHDYAQLFGNEQRCYQSRNSLLVDGRTSIVVDKWMTLPDMGYVIASRYNVMLVSLSIDQSMTFFPLRGHPPTNHKILCIGYADGNHWYRYF
ncbi:MULE transposase domain [Sesbania bispinosa]|nr:MULE transposase domain [Sesbania bispinosa]